MSNEAVNLSETKKVVQFGEVIEHNEWYKLTCGFNSIKEIEMNDEPGKMFVCGWDIKDFMNKLVIESVTLKNFSVEDKTAHPCLRFEVKCRMLKDFYLPKEVSYHENFGHHLKTKIIFSHSHSNSDSGVYMSKCGKLSNMECNRIRKDEVGIMIIGVNLYDKVASYKDNVVKVVIKNVTYEFKL